MCGIAGAYSFSSNAAPVDTDELLSIRDHMQSRGPDGAGLWINADRTVGLGHRRLAIIDLSASGHQPMMSRDERYHITFNGEIYNFGELRDLLIARGHSFNSSSDTEVLLYGYAEFGTKFLDMLQGMFAFAIWDSYKHELFLARDPLGIKPLYWSSQSGTFLFASQVKALAASRRLRHSPSAAGHAGYLLWGFVPEPYSLFNEIHSLPPGHYAIVAKDKGIETKRYFDLTSEIRTWERAADDQAHGDWGCSLRTVLLSSVQRHLIADVPVGVFLSAGIDSTTIAALAAESINQPLNTVTLGFEEYRNTPNDETVIAQQVADRLGANHSTIWIRKRDFSDELNNVMESMDQPSCDGLNSYFISRAAKQAGLKVVLSGLGGDELFRSYPSFTQIPLLVSRIRSLRGAPIWGKTFRQLSAPLVKRITSPKFASVFEYGRSISGAYQLRRGLFMPWELQDEINPEFLLDGIRQLQTTAQLDALVKGIKSPALQITSLEVQWYMQAQLLRDTDWASMAHSVEVRVPFVDVKLLRELGPMLASASPPTKINVAQAPKQPPLGEAINKRKTGFTVPVNQWISNLFPAYRKDRGVRGWARIVYSREKRNRLFHLLVTDAFGGRGGIAKFNRDFINGIADSGYCDKVTAQPRHIVDLYGLIDMSPRINWVAESATGKLQFTWSALINCLKRPPDVLVAGHINFAPLAWIISLITGRPFALVLHGVEAWTPRASSFVNFGARRANHIISVSRITMERFSSWSGHSTASMLLLPNCVDQSRFFPGERNISLAEKMGLSGRKVLLTIGRLVSAERYKGFDEVLDVLPELLSEFPDITYVVAGEGPDGARLQTRAQELGLSGHVLFTGFIDEDAKCDLYRLADVYVMPSRGEGFGIVFLEAIACGTPAIGSTLDGSSEALLGGKLGVLINPDDKVALKIAIAEQLRVPRPAPKDVSHYSQSAFNTRVAQLVRKLS